MRVLLLVAHGSADISGPAERKLDLRHAAAIGRKLLERGRARPWLAAERGLAGLDDAALADLPHQLIGAGISGAGVALWSILRQMGGESFCIVAFGERAQRLGRMLQRLARKKIFAFAPVFLLNAPASCPGFSGRDIFLCGSRIVAGKLAEGLPDDRRPRFCVCQPGLAFEAPAKRPASHFVFGMSRSLAPGSGALTVVRAMACIWQREDLPPWEVRMYGEGPRYAEILDAARVLGVAGRLCLLGAQDMRDALAQCSAWLAPGSFAAEPPSALWLGLACRLPVIASKSPLHMERLEAAQDAALLVPERDPQALAQAMIRVLSGHIPAHAAAPLSLPFMLDEAADRWAGMIEGLDDGAGSGE